MSKKPGRPPHPEELKRFSVTLTKDQIDHGKSAAGGMSSLVRDLIDAHRFELPTVDVVQAVLAAAQRVGVVSGETEIDRPLAERVVSSLRGEGSDSAGSIGEWYVTDHAIESACQLLGFDDADDDHWDYVARLLEGLASVAKFKQHDAPTGHEVWRVGQAHKRLRMLVSREDRPEGDLPQVIDVWASHAGWKRPRRPMRLPIPGDG